MPRLISFVFQKNLFVYLFFGFIFATIAGTLAHERGHYIMARYYGHANARIRYKYTTYGNAIGTVDTKQTRAIITAAGPIETMLAGTIGISVLVLFRMCSQQADVLDWRQWIVILISLSWLRELFNLCIAFALLIKDKHRQFYGDEFRLSRMLGYDQWILPVVTGTIAAIILVIIIFRYIPVQQRFTFVIAGFTGALTGAWLWLIALGPKFLP